MKTGATARLEKSRVRLSGRGHAGCEWNRIEFLSSAFIQNQKHYQFKPGELMKLLYCESKCNCYTAAFLLFPQERPMQQIQVILEE